MLATKVGHTSRGKVRLATVKGDVHDIGKNIVGTVLACNDFEVIDLGVLVPCEKILTEAKKHGAQVIGLSGLITPSLDEMVHVAKEMQREGFTVPLLIGGATTSSKHTAVKIAQHYDHEVVHVLDASRSVPVVEKLVNPESRKAFGVEIKAKQEEERASFAMRRDRKFVDFNEAKKRKFAIDWDSFVPAKPKVLGPQEIAVTVAELRPYIDWSPFFMTWELKGKFPKIFEDSYVGAIAKELYDDAQAVLDSFEKDPSIVLKGVYGFFPAKSLGDTIVLYSDESQSAEIARFEMLRQQWERVGPKFVPKFGGLRFVEWKNGLHRSVCHHSGPRCRCDSQEVARRDGGWQVDSRSSMWRTDWQKRLRRCYINAYVANGASKRTSATKTSLKKNTRGFARLLVTHRARTTQKRLRYGNCWMLRSEPALA